VSIGSYAEPTAPPLTALVYVGYRYVGSFGGAGVRAKLSNNTWVDRNPYASNKWWCFDVAASQNYPGVVWAILEDDDDDSLEHLYRSNNYGATWTLYDQTLINASVETYDLRSLSSRGNDIYVGVHLADAATGVWKADAQNPTTWTQVATLYPTGTGQQGFVSIWPASDRVWFTNDRLISGVNRHFFYTLGGVTSVVNDTVNDSSVGRLTGTPGVGGQAYGVAGSVGAGAQYVFRIGDTAVVDIRPLVNTLGSFFGKPFAVDADIVLISYHDDATGLNTLYRSTNSGSTWSIVSGISGDSDFGGVAEIGQVLSADQDNPNLLYASGTAPYIWISTDAGVTWTKESTGSTALGRVPGVISSSYPLR
jgi:hypothetical protein